MQKLLLFFISFLLGFTFVNQVFSQNTAKTYINPTGGDVPSMTWGKTSPIGYTNSDQGDISMYAKNFCISATGYDNSSVVNVEYEPYNKSILYFKDKNKANSGSSSKGGNKMTTITCTIEDPIIRGCTNPEATNYNSQATEDDNSCVIPPPKIQGCTNPNALNYNPSATEDNGTCQEKIEGCTDTTAINYNPQANVHKEFLCQYAPPYTPQDITGVFEKSQVSTGATTWTMRLNLNVTGAILEPSRIQTWSQFTPISAQTDNKTITITLRQFNDDRLSVECTNYEVTIPRNTLTTTQGETNSNPISGNFEVVGCKTPNGQGEENEENTGTGTTNQPQHENTIKENNFYLSLYDTDEKGKAYVNLTNIIYLLGFLAFFSILFFVLFGFIKNSFLGKQQRR